MCGSEIVIRLTVVMYSGNHATKSVLDGPANILTNNNKRTRPNGTVKHPVLEEVSKSWLPPRWAGKTDLSMALKLSKCQMTADTANMGRTLHDSQRSLPFTGSSSEPAYPLGPNPFWTDWWPSGQDWVDSSHLAVLMIFSSTDGIEYGRANHSAA